jgi:large subunit ribosomal protein L23
MSQERLMNVLIEPHISEKSSVVADQNNQVVFKVAVDANKDEIKKAVELMFEVAVDSVQVMNMKGKTKRAAGGMGRRKNWKKAYISLKEGQDINFAGVE